MIQTETDIMEMTSQLDSISSAIEDIRLGKVVIWWMMKIGRTKAILFVPRNA